MKIFLEFFNNEIFKIDLLFGKYVPKPPRYYNIVSKTNVLLVIWSMYIHDIKVIQVSYYFKNLLG
jgi:hypothetical protein